MRSPHLWLRQPVTISRRSLLFVVASGGAATYEGPWGGLFMLIWLYLLAWKAIDLGSEALTKRAQLGSLRRWVRREQFMLVTHVPNFYAPGDKVQHEGAEWVVSRCGARPPTSTSHDSLPCWVVYGRRISA